MVGAENENDECRDTIDHMHRNAGDSMPQYIRATKGYEARQTHLNNWYEANEHPFILLLDRDMAFSEDTLTRLRSHKLPYISGLYMRRRYAPLAPVWFNYNHKLEMPMIPFTDVPSPNTLYKLGASGWGCILLHRDVITAVRPILKGEPEIIEDDMDVYPYDLKRVMDAIHALDRGITEGMTRGEAQRNIAVLKEEIRPLRGLKDSVGSDIRFPFYARMAGFDLYGDSGVMCKHMLNYPLSPEDYLGQSAAAVRDVALAIRNDVTREYERVQKATAEL